MTFDTVIPNIWNTDYLETLGWKFSNSTCLGPFLTISLSKVVPLHQYNAFKAKLHKNGLFHICVMVLYLLWIFNELFQKTLIQLEVSCFQRLMIIFWELFRSELPRMFASPRKSIPNLKISVFFFALLHLPSLNTSIERFRGELCIKLNDFIFL